MDIKTNIKNVALKTKEHVKRNRVAYVAGAVATAAIALQQSNKNAFYAFLESKDIDPMEYYCPEAYEELNPS